MNPVNFKDLFYSFLLEISKNNEINNYYIVEERDNVSYHNLDDEQLHQKDFGSIRKLMYLNMKFGYAEFKLYLTRLNIPLCSPSHIKKFLKTESTYIGIIRAKRINSHVARCHIIDITDIPDDQHQDDKDRLIISLYKVIEQQISRINMLDLELQKHKSILKQATM